MYSYVFRKKFGVEEDTILYYHLRSGTAFRTHRSQRDHDYIRRLAHHVANEVVRDVFIPFYGFHCNFCKFKVPCDKYTVSHHGGPTITLEGRIKPARKFEDWDVQAPHWLEGQAVEK